MKSNTLLTKSIVVTIIVVGFLFHSCSNEENITEFGIPNENISKYIPEPIRLPSKSIEWDGSYHPYESKLKVADNQSTEMAVTTSNIFISGVYSAKSIKDLTYNWLQKPCDPTWVCYTFPGYYIDCIKNPSIVSMYASLKKATYSPDFTGKQSLSFEYDYKEFSHYNELKLAFGADVNVAALFKLNASLNEDKVSLKSGLFARVVQKNFSVIMDYPEDGNVFKNNSDLNTYASLSPVYVNSITFGRMAIIAIESNYSFEELKTSFKVAFSAKVVNGELSLDTKTKEILSDAQIKIIASGGKGQDVAKLVSGFEEFKSYIINGGEFTKDVPGVPIFFTANYVSDNSVFTNSFVAQ